MPESQIIDWLQENGYRSYPLVTNSNKKANTNYILGEEVLLDALICLPSNATNIVLTSIVADNTNVVFNVGSLVFTVARAAVFPAYLRLASGSLLVIGDVTNIPNGTHNFTNVYFENSVCFEFGAEWLGVSSVSFDSSAELIGSIILKEGYQFGIVNTVSTLEFWADPAFGTPLGCFSLGTTNDCGDIVSFVNGVGPVNNTLKFSRGNDVIVLEDPDNHRIFVGLSFSETDICKTIPINPEL